MAEPSKTLKTVPGKISNLKSEQDINNLVYGRVQPQAIPIEEAILGAIMVDKDALPSVIEILRKESFYLQAHQEIYGVMLELFSSSRPIDLLTVHESLKKKLKLEEIGGVSYLMELTNKVASAANIEYHARIVAQKYIQRELIKVSSQIIQDSFEDTKDVLELLDEAERGLYDITDQNLNTGYEALSSLAAKAKKEIEATSQKGTELTGVTTGFAELDKMTNGWQRSDLIIIAARPGMGKTAFTLSLAKNASEHGHAVAVFSLEMASVQLVQRLISMEAEITSTKLRNGQMDDVEWRKLDNAVNKLSEMPIYIDDTPGINIFELRAKCRRLKQNHDIDMIVIDYLQLMAAAPNEKRGNREQEISSISRALKGLAKELNVPVIALSQLSRAVESRGGEKRPQLSDLRESGAIEQDADIVTFIYRPDYYGLGEGDFDTPSDLSEIILAKHRNGGLGTVQLRFRGEFVKFENPGNDGFSMDIFKNDSYNTNIVTRPSRMNKDLSDDGFEEIPF
ncbi:MAG TPA: replicative DNA helicase [Saprospiraceae bacterium]|nr:replicative DNA helicase [Lewinellaceae bacterium]HPK09435.1 replicative DNA helicase [Saprospiraceae bacterium]HPQ20304.1 replicative DNA helicase [Saprospiraceae bacterium]